MLEFVTKTINGELAGCVMKKITLAIVAVGAFMGTPALAADMAVKAPPPPPGCAVNDIVKANNQLSVDFAATYIQYGPEYQTGGGPLDSETGWVPGGSVTGSVMRTFAGVCDVYLMGRLTVVDGSTHYWASSGPVLSNTDGAMVMDLDFRVGKGFALNPNLMLTPYLGLGSNLWVRRLTGPSGYNEDYSHDYAGGGLLVQYSPAPRWVLSVDGLIGEAFNSSMTASLTPGGFALPAPLMTFTLGNRPVYMAGASVDYAVTEQWHVNAGIDYVQFSYGQSAVNGFGYLEPNSSTSYVTVSVGGGYHW